MLLAKVKEAVVATAEAQGLTANKLLLAEIMTIREQQLTGTGRYLVCLDGVGAGPGELVLAVQGSSARMAPHLQDSPTDAVVVGIIDALRAGGRSVQ